MKRPLKPLHPLAPSFGFAEIMREPNHGRFANWYGRTERLDGKRDR